MLWRAYEAWQCGSVGQDASQMQPHLALPADRSVIQACHALRASGRSSKGKTVSQMWCTDHAHRSAIQAWRTLGAGRQADVQIRACIPLLAAAIDVELAHLPKQHCCCQEPENAAVRCYDSTSLDIFHDQDADDRYKGKDCL